jgi:hypothetical protein
MKTNELKKGTRVQLRCGWYATVADNAKGTIRMCDVEGVYREIGSVYAHDIMRAYQPQVIDPRSGGMGYWVAIEHTPAQEKLRQTVGAF